MTVARPRRVSRGRDDPIQQRRRRPPRRPGRVRRCRRRPRSRSEDTTSAAGTCAAAQADLPEPDAPIEHDERGIGDAPGLGRVGGVGVHGHQGGRALAGPLPTRAGSGPGLVQSWPGASWSWAGGIGLGRTGARAAGASVSCLRMSVRRVPTWMPATLSASTAPESGCSMMLSSRCPRGDVVVAEPVGGAQGQVQGAAGVPGQPQVQRGSPDRRRRARRAGPRRRRASGRLRGRRPCGALGGGGAPRRRRTARPPPAGRRPAPRRDLPGPPPARRWHRPACPSGRAAGARCGSRLPARAASSLALAMAARASGLESLEHQLLRSPAVPSTRFPSCHQAVAGSPRRDADGARAVAR